MTQHVLVFGQFQSSYSLCAPKFFGKRSICNTVHILGGDVTDVLEATLQQLFTTKKSLGNLELKRTKHRENRMNDGKERETVKDETEPVNRPLSRELDLDSGRDKSEINVSSRSVIHDQRSLRCAKLDFCEGGASDIDRHPTPHLKQDVGAVPNASAGREGEREGAT